MDPVPLFPTGRQGGTYMAFVIGFGLLVVAFLVGRSVPGCDRTSARLQHLGYAGLIAAFALSIAGWTFGAPTAPPALTPSCPQTERGPDRAVTRVRRAFRSVEVGPWSLSSSAL